MRRCEYCGSELPDDQVVCPQQDCPKEQPQSQQPAPTEAPAENQETPAQPAKKKLDQRKIAMLFAGSVAFVVVMLVVLIATHVICVFHKYAAATCVAPETCIYCEKTRSQPKGHDWTEATCTAYRVCKSCGMRNGVALGHQMLEATCTEPASCDRCGEIQGQPLGHVEIRRVTKVPATLLTEGQEESVCTACGISYETITTSVKRAGVENGAFNFKDEEIIAWINTKTQLQVSTKDLQPEGYGENATGYHMILEDEQMAMLVCLHNEEGNITQMLTVCQATPEKGRESAYTIAKSLDGRITKFGEFLIDAISWMDVGDATLESGQVVGVVKPKTVA